MFYSERGVVHGQEVYPVIDSPACARAPAEKKLARKEYLLLKNSARSRVKVLEDRFDLEWNNFRLRAEIPSGRSSYAKAV